MTRPKIEHINVVSAGPARLMHCLLLALGVWVASTAHAPCAVAQGKPLPAVKRPFPAEPLRCYSRRHEMFCLLGDGTLRSSAGRTVLHLRPPKGHQIEDVVCDVRGRKRAACLYIASRTEGPKSHPKVHQELVLVESHKKRRRISHGYVHKGYSAVARGLYFRAGRLAFAYSEQLPGKPNRDVVELDGKRMVTDWPRESLGATLIDLTSERPRPLVQFFVLKKELWALARNGNELEVAKVGPTMRWQPAAGPSLYDTRVMVAQDGYAYILYYDPSENCAMAATSQDGVTWTAQVLDDQESGWQLDVARAGYGIVATWYYYRNSYNKGLRVAFLRDGLLLQPANTVTRREDRNTGFHPHIGVTRSGTTRLTWWDDVMARHRVWTQLESPLDLTEVGPARDFDDWRDDYKIWSVLAGAGGWYTFWNTFELGLSDQDVGGAAPKTASLDLANTLLVTGLVEARLWDVQLTAGYAQSLIDKADERTGGTLKSLIGSARVDDLFLGHDIQVSGVFGRYTGVGRPGERADFDNVGPISIDTLYWNAQAVGINKWRMKYGLSYGRFQIPVSLNSFVAEAGQTKYAYTGTYFRNATFDDIRLVVGYSKLDYVARYENAFSDWILDAEALGGVALMKFADVAPDNGPKVGDLMRLSLGAHLSGGWLFMRRVQALAGLGLYVRLMYRVDTDLLLGLGTPSERKEDDSKKADTELTMSLLSLRHGPWVDVGLVW